jgi:ornithine carbamoyltransferase
MTIKTGMTIKKRDFLVIDDLTVDELNQVLDYAAAAPTVGLLAPGQVPIGVALIFEKPSLRTRNACEMAVAQLGGHPVAIFDAEIQLGRRESIGDVAQVLSGYYGVVTARVFGHHKVEDLAKDAPVPVINLLSDHEHPCQALADLLTIKEEFGSFDDRTVAWIGDFSNVARSLCVGAVMLGMSVRFGCPHGYGPTDVDLGHLRSRAVSGASVVVCPNPAEAVTGADVVSTDAWYSMGQEAEKQLRAQAFEGYRVDTTMMREALPHAIFLHCLPAHRGEEVTDEVMDSKQSRVFPQAHNRMHTFRGLLTWLCA